MRNFAVKTLLFCSPLLVLALLFNFILDGYFGNPLNWRPFEKMEWILTVKNQNFDYAFIGSSRVKYMVDTPTIDRFLHVKSVNLGTDGSGFADNYLLYSAFLSNGNTVKTLIINVDPYVLDSKHSFGYPFHDFFFLPRLHDENVSQTVKNISGIKKWLTWKYVPLAKYLEFNEKFILSFVHSFKDQDPQRAIERYENNAGADFITNVLNEPFPDRDKDSFVFDDTDAEYLLKIVTLARSSGSNVLLYTAPEYQGIEKFQTGRSESEARAKKLAGENGLTFLDIADKDIEQDSTFFRDWLHLNATGTRIFSQRIIDALK
ncbi:MAG: hypothetical protein WCT54_05745 [Patescibacteria group bacterium]|jgi:hypothetical protein